jgi:hypothetical protein
MLESDLEPLGLCVGTGKTVLPMARVRKQNPTITPRYPTNGKIHMLKGHDDARSKSRCKRLG